MRFKQIPQKLLVLMGIEPHDTPQQMKDNFAFIKKSKNTSRLLDRTSYRFGSEGT